MPTDSSIEIYCPHCHWEPDGGAHWQCRCGHTWNTFETAGTCPNCRYRWRVTACPPGPGGCGAVSPHIDWYHGLDALVKELVEEALAVPASSASCRHHRTTVTVPLRWRGWPVQSV